MKDYLNFIIVEFFKNLKDDKEYEAYIYLIRFKATIDVLLRVTGSLTKEQWNRYINIYLYLMKRYELFRFDTM